MQSQAWRTEGKTEDKNREKEKGDKGRTEEGETGEQEKRGREGGRQEAGHQKQQEERGRNSPGQSKSIRGKRLFITFRLKAD